MDERLKEVHQTDLTESRINEEFVDWLKTKGLSWLLVILLALCAYLVVVRWKQHKVDYRNEAWSAYLESEQSGLPSSFEGVADEYPDIGAIPHLARVGAAVRLMRAVQTGQTLAATETEPVALTPDERVRYLDRAEALYDRVVEADDGSLGMALLIVSAINGQAAVAECKGNTERARDRYLAAAERAEAFYPGLALQARARAESASAFAAPIDLPRQIDLVRASPPRFDPPVLDEALRDLLMPADG